MAGEQVRKNEGTPHEPSNLSLPLSLALPHQTVLISSSFSSSSSICRGSGPNTCAIAKNHFP